MSFADWFAARPRFRFLDDSFALDRPALEVGLIQAIGLQRAKCDEVWLTAHFFDTFVWLQDFLSAAGIDYEIVEEPVSIADVQKRSPARVTQAGDTAASGAASGTSRVRLVLATFIQPPKSRPDRPPSGWANVAVIVCEKHPLADENARLALAMKAGGASVVFGHMLTLNDPLVRPLVTPMVSDVMRQFGLDEQQMVNNRFLSQQLTRKLNRDAKTYTSSEPAESSDAWVRLNTR